MGNLVVCCDGTWNDPGMNKNGIPTTTNVYRLYNAVVRDSVDQVAYYHSGVGVDGTFWGRIMGGATGAGLDSNIRSAYMWLARHYKPDDRIFIFGFSRGAYTARAVAGMIAKCGLLKFNAVLPATAAEWAQVKRVFEGYRDGDPGMPDPLVPFHDTAPGDHPKGKTKIHFVGVWETVGALGIPMDFGLVSALNWFRGRELHDTVLSPFVEHGRHALALDEWRETFQPTMWTIEGTQQPEQSDRIKQIWFPGSHSDVGGGYLETGLSDGALLWMIEEAQGQGLLVRPGMLDQICPDAHGPLHNSSIGHYARLRSAPRTLPYVTDDPSADYLHQSARWRVNHPLITTGDYRRSLKLAIGDSHEFPVYADQRWNDFGVFLEAEGTYALSASGEWLDARVVCGPAGRIKFRPSVRAILAALAWKCGSFIGWLQDVFVAGVRQYYSWFRKGADVPKFERLHFWGTLRQRQIGWFHLVCVVANGRTGDESSYDPAEVFDLAEPVTITPVRDGYLYGFANDVWSFYANNRGHVRLTITRTA